MKRRIVVALLLPLLLSLLVMPVAGAADGSKSVVKEMVQSPADYSVGNSFIFVGYELPVYRFYDNYWDFSRVNINDLANWLFLRIMPPGP